MAYGLASVFQIWSRGITFPTKAGTVADSVYLDPNKGCYVPLIIFTLSQGYHSFPLLRNLAPAGIAAPDEAMSRDQQTPGVNQEEIGSASKKERPLLHGAVR